MICDNCDMPFDEDESDAVDPDLYCSQECEDEADEEQGGLAIGE